jgi:hypothetical protein
MRRAVLTVALLAVLAVPAAATVPPTQQRAAGRLAARVLPGSRAHIDSGGTLRMVLPKGTPDPNRPGRFGPMWRTYLIIGELAARFPAIAWFDIAGVRLLGLQGGSVPRGTVPPLDSVSLRAARNQLDDNLAVLAAGLPASASLNWHVDTIRLDLPRRRFAFSVRLHVGNLIRLRAHLGDLVLGPEIGLSDRIEGLAVELRDDHRRVLGSWGTVRMGGALNYPPDGSGYATTLPFHNHFGGPSQVTAVHG